jgi:hypothetical protein
VYACVASLLGRPEWGASAQALIAGYNSTFPEHKQKFAIQERREMFRAALSEETRRREIAVIGFEKSLHYLELTLERAHRLASAKHCRAHEGKWIANTRESHLQKWLKSKGESVLASALWPALLHDNMLGRLGSAANLEPNNELVIEQALLSARWGDDRANWTWDRPTFTAEQTPEEVRVGQRQSETLAMTALDYASRSNSLSETYLAWIISECPKTLSVIDIAGYVSLFDDWSKHEKLLQSLQNNFEGKVIDVLRGNLFSLSIKDRIRLFVRSRLRKNK